MSEKHEHNWESIPGWRGRYRCSKCFVIGYIKDGPIRGLRGKIIPYKCSFCDASAVAKEPPKTKPTGRKTWRCSNHRNEVS